MKRIVVVGEYGINSLGDEAMLHVLARGLMERLGEVCITPISRLARLPWGGDAIGEPMARASEMMQACRNNLAWSLLDYDQLRDEEIEREESYLVWKPLLEADAVLVGGGNLFVDVNGDFIGGPMTMFPFAIYAAKALGKPVVLFSASIGPLETEWGHKITADALRLCDAVIVRDRRSQELAHQMGTESVLLPDLAVGLEPKGELIELNLDYLAVAPAWTGDYKRWVPDMIYALHVIHEETGLRPLFIPQCSFGRSDMDNDATLCSRMVDMYGEGADRIDGPGTLIPEIALNVYCQCQAALTVRLHGAVFAAVAGLPFVALNYWPKVRGFCEQVGSPCVEMDRDSMAGLAKMFIKTWERREEERKRVRQRVSEMQAQLPEYWDILEEIIT